MSTRCRNETKCLTLLSLSVLSVTATTNNYNITATTVPSSPKHPYSVANFVHNDTRSTNLSIPSVDTQTTFFFSIPESLNLEFEYLFLSFNSQALLSSRNSESLVSKRQARHEIHYSHRPLRLRS